MDKIAAMRFLDSASAHERLIGARFLARFASNQDIGQINQALLRENVSWVRNALSEALRRATGQESPAVDEQVETDGVDLSPSDRQLREIYANALQETTSLLLHEIEPLLGTIRLYANREIGDFAHSRTKNQLELLDTLLDAISQLRRATGPAQPVEIELSGLIREICDQEMGGPRVKIQLAGPSPFIVVADRGRLLLAVTNGLRNAREATTSAGEPNERPIVVNWNKTDQDFWISVIDQGVGLKGSLERIFEIGTSSKKSHLGMGLPAARQAIISMGGDITVTPRDDAGVRFEIRWPILATASP
jgi:signal transduction histidine kinase